MTSQRRIAVLFGLVVLVGLCVVALMSSYTDRYFSGLAGIEEDLTTKTEQRLATLGADSAIVIAEGRDLSITLPRGLPDGSTEDSLKRELLHTEGVRVVSFDFIDSSFTSDSAAAPDPAPTTAPAPEPTAVPATGADRRACHQSRPPCLHQSRPPRPTPTRRKSSGRST